jgi:acyl-CoA reductase-like NAD-dependent aldehyde dehydrogenase
MLTDLLPKYLDSDSIKIVNGGVKETSELLTYKFDHIFYTGNGMVARIVMAAAAKHLTPVTLELGGKNPVLIDRNTNLKTAARRITFAKLLNNGQICLGPDYVLVPRELETEFLQEVKKVIVEFWGSEDPRGAADYGRIINERHFDRLMALINDPEVTIALGGKGDRGSLYIAPTVLRNFDVTKAKVMKEEIFGPILAVIPYDTLDDAIRFISARDKPLALYLFSTSSSTIKEVSLRTSSGSMCVNDLVVQCAPGCSYLGGVGESGMGAWHGKRTFDVYSHYRPILHRSIGMEVVNNLVRYPRDGAMQPTWRILDFVIFPFKNSMPTKGSMMFFKAVRTLLYIIVLYLVIRYQPSWTRTKKYIVGLLAKLKLQNY